MAEQQGEEQEKFSKGTKFFKSVTIPGLSVQYGDTPAPNEPQQLVTFQQRKFFDDRTREHYIEGYLATDESDAIEVLTDDVNVTEISKDDFEKAMKDSVAA